MPGKSITLELPEDLYEHVRQIAEQSQRPPEHIVLESIRLLFVPPPASTDFATSLEALRSYADEQLWAVVFRRLAERKGALKSLAIRSQEWYRTFLRCKSEIWVSHIGEDGLPKALCKRPLLGWAEKPTWKRLDRV